MMRLVCVCKAIPVIDEDRGEVVCPACGIVKEENLIEQRPEGIPDDKQERRRFGYPTTNRMFDRNLPTEIGLADATGKKIIGNYRNRLYQIKDMDTFIKKSTSHYPSMMGGLRKLGKLCDNINSPEAVIEESAIFLRKVIERGLVRGRSIDEVVCACVYLVHQKNNIPRTLKEMTRIMNIRKKYLTRMIRIIKKEFEMKNTLSDPELYLNKICSVLMVNEKVKRTASETINKFKQNGHTDGRSPTIICATAVYHTIKKLGLDISQRRIAEASGTTEVTLRNSLKDAIINNII